MLAPCLQVIYEYMHTKTACGQRKEKIYKSGMIMHLRLATEMFHYAYEIVYYIPLESIISPSAILLDLGLINSLPLILVNSSGTVKLNSRVSVCSNI